MSSYDKFSDLTINSSGDLVKDAVTYQSQMVSLYHLILDSIIYSSNQSHRRMNSMLLHHF